MNNPEFPEVLLDAAACLAEVLEKKGIPTEKASDWAWEAVDALRRRWGGMDVYIPKAGILDMAPKHQQVFERWKAGEDVLTLVREFGYTAQWIRMIIRSARLARSQQVTGTPLFGLD